MDPPRVKAFPVKDFAKELPVDTIKRLLQVKFKENSPEFPRLGLVDDLLKGYDPLKDDVNAPQGEAIQDCEDVGFS